MSRLQAFVLVLLGALVSLVSATAAPLFCKCTCFKNSTLIQLGAQASCTQCTHAFCLAQNLPICKDAAAETDVLSTCIQRDSRKDQIIVWGFILGTAGLLGWAAAKRVHELREGRKAAAAAAAAAAAGGGGGGGLGTARSNVRNRGAYAPLSHTRV